MTYSSAFHRRWATTDWSNRHSNCNFFPTIKFPIPQFHIISYICKYPWVIMCYQIRFEGSELSWQLSWYRAPVFSEWPSVGDTSRMSISRLRTITWNSKLSWPKSRDWGDPKVSYNRISAKIVSRRVFRLMPEPGIEPGTFRSSV